MYVCLCNGITESQIRGAVGGGARSLSEPNLCLDMASCCGRFADCAQQVFHETFSSGQLPREQSNAA
jgi:bacterioferritin-associated ferredoxin